jgi:hypothetical protein
MGAAFSANSWNRYNSSLNCYKKFLKTEGKFLQFPFNKESLRGFVSWALNTKLLQPNTVRVYISDLKLSHQLRDLECNIFEDFFTRTMLKGADNLNMYNNITKKTKLAMTFNMLKILGHQICKSNWESEKKRLFWAASCLAFFGSFRMGEILPTNNNFNTAETLNWNDIKFRNDDSILINIKFPKRIKDKNGDFADIFPLTGKKYCPVNLLKILHSKANKSTNFPVFTYSSGKALTVADFSKDLKILLFPVFGPVIQFLSGHSFRAGIPSALSNCPDIANDNDVCIWGRWSSTAFKAYTKLKMSARKNIFEKILRAISR